MRKHRGFKLITIAKGVALWDEKYDNMEHHDRLIWEKLYRLYLKARACQGKFYYPWGYERQTAPLFISDINNNKFNTPHELIEFIENHFLGLQLKPKYKVKTFQL